MKEKNKPEPEIVVVEQTTTKEEKKAEKRERKYIALSDVEINDFIDTYRKLLRLPQQEENEKELLKDKIESLEREMIRRNKIKSKQ